MPLELPNLDDRDFEALLQSAKKRIQDDLNTNWNDLTPGDPGVVLLEAFAYLTDQLLYRLNRLPEKAYVAFLQLLGVTLNPPTAAWVKLKFWHTQEANKTEKVPVGTRVTISGSAPAGDRQPPVFLTTRAIEVPKDSTNEESAVEVEAVHCEWVEESLGASQGVLGQKFRVQLPPIVARMGNPFDLRVGIEVPPGENKPEDWQDAQKTMHYRLWKEVEHFAGLPPGAEVFRVDRQAGIIEFAPAARLRWQSGPQAVQTEPVQALAGMPLAGRQIRAWYPHGGGEAGNVPARSLNTILPAAGGAAPQGLSVTNPQSARGGIDAETLENALVRGPQEIYSLERAVTPRDFELLALRATRLLARAQACAARDLWKHAPLGMVDLVVAPVLAGVASQQVSDELLRQAQHEKALQEVQAALVERSPLGISNRIRWARYKKIWVEAELTVQGNEPPPAAEARLTELLYDLINPLPGEVSAEIGSQSASLQRIARGGWPYGQALRMAEVYRWILSAQKENALVHALTIHLEHAPDRNVSTLATDFSQPHTWYAGSETGVFRSTNNADGWELVLDLQPESDLMVFHRRRDAPSLRDARAAAWETRQVTRRERVRLVRPCRSMPGLVAVASEFQDEQGQLRSPLYLSPDCGESWYAALGSVDAEIEDMAWMQTGGGPALLLATDQGLRKMDVLLDRDGRFQHLPVATIPVIAGQPKHPLYAVAVISNDRGAQRVAAAAKSRQGVHISSGADLVPLTDGQSQPPGSKFSLLGLQQEDIRHLNVQTTGDRIFLWAGSMAPGDLGHGCMRWQLEANLSLVDQGRWISSGWTGGSCYALAFWGSRILAVTAWGGVLSADFDESQPDLLPVWQSLPQEDLPRRRTELEEMRGRRGIFQSLTSIACNDVAGGETTALLVGSEAGIHRSLDRGASFSNVSRRSFVHLRDAITIPPDWLFVSGEHKITVRQGVSAAAAGHGRAVGEPGGSGGSDAA